MRNGFAVFGLLVAVIFWKQLLTAIAVLGGIYGLLTSGARRKEERELEDSGYYYGKR
jgi:protein-S-isoprenylcysteine O-methyltransferase Ste14